jgi:hypothetical protein
MAKPGLNCNRSLYFLRLSSRWLAFSPVGDVYFYVVVLLANFKSLIAIDTKHL